MKFRYTTHLLWTMLLGSIAFGHSAFAQTRLGLHVTQEELNIWRQRAVSGPYRVSGDVSTNSPGDWTRINNNATTFRSNPAAERWAGQPGGSCWSHQTSPAPALPGRGRGELLRDAAFRFLLMGDTADRDAVLTELLAQAATAGTNWADSTRWNTGETCLHGDSHSWEISMWMTKLLYAYDYIRRSISAGNRTTLDAWFTNYGTLMVSNTDFNPTQVFRNRLSDNYSTQNVTTCTGAVLTHFGGWTYCATFHEVWNNRSGSHIRALALTGIMTANSTFQSRAKRWIKEWIRFSNFSDNTAGETYRGVESGWVGHSFHYPAMALTTYIDVADAFARASDTELYDYSTSLGDNTGTLTPAGGPKTLLGISSKFLDHVDHTLLRYATSSPANNGNSNYLIDSVCELCSESYNHDTYFAQGNLYWRSARIASVYTRQASGAPAYPAAAAGWGGGCTYCGGWAVLPGVLFMFGQMEGKVNPYGGITSAPPPSPTSTLAVTADSTYAGYTTVPINDGIINAAGGTVTTWASADNQTSDHWINVTLPLPQQINTATLHWAYNSSQQKYMTSQRVDVQYWNGSSYVTAATITYPGFDIPSSTVSFPAITTSQIRFYQPANQGNPTYSGILWVTEVEYASKLSPSAPTALQVSVTP